MATVYSRLSRIFCSTQKLTNAILNPSNRKATANATKFAPKILSAGEQPTPINSTPSYPCISAAVQDLLNEKDYDQLLQKFTSLSKILIFRRRQPKVYEFVIHRLSLAKRFSLIEQALEPQKEFIYGERFAARLIYLYGRAGMYDHAYKVFDELPERKCKRGTRAFNALLIAAVSAEKFDKAYELFRELPGKLSIKPDVDAYNRVAYALCRLGLFDEAESLLDEMRANGLNPNVNSFNILMGAFYKKGDIEKGEKTWKKMIESGLVPSVPSYNCKLWGLVNEGKLTEAIKIVEELITKNLKPDLGTYNPLIQGSCKNGDLEGAKRWYAELLEQGCEPNKVTLGTLVPFLCEKADYGFAFKVCEYKLKKQCLVIDEALLQNVVDGLVKNSMMDEAETLVKATSSSYVPYSIAMPSELPLADVQIITV